MDKNQLIKWALIAAAAYLIYRYVLKDGLFGGGTTPTIPTPLPGTQPVTQPPAIPPGGTTVTTPVAPAIRVNDALLIAAALGTPGFVADARTAGVKLNSDQWNYYRAQGGGTVPNVDIFPEGDRAALMTIDQYLEARHSHGLSGLAGLNGPSGWGTLARMAAVNPWIT